MRCQFIVAVLLLFATASCSSKADLTTNTFSKKFKIKSEKIAFMEKYYKPNFKYLDVEYHIVYHDNETGLLSGPSNGDLFFAFKMDSSELVKISTQETSGPFELASRVDFLPSTKTWNTDYPKTYYQSGDVIIWENKILLRTIYNNLKNSEQNSLKSTKIRPFT